MGGRFLIWLFAFTLAGIAAVAGLNIAVDPTSYLTNAHLVSSTVCTPGIRADQRQSKTIAAKAFAPDALLVGTSQIGVGFAAGDPILRRTLGRTYNLGISGLGTSEMMQLLRDTVPATKVHRVIVGLSFGLMIDFDPRQSAFPREPGPPQLAWLWTLKRSVLSLNALFASASAVSSSQNCARPADALDGTTRYPGAGRPLKLRERHAQWAVTQTVPDAAAFRRAYRRNLADMEDAVAHLCARGITVDLALLPNHALRMEIWSNMVGDARMDQWKRDMTGMADRFLRKGCAISLWDFSYHNAVTTVDFDGPDAASPSFPYWEDSHFKMTVGHRILARMLLGSGEGFGVKLTPRSVDAQLARAACARDSWRRSHPAVVAAMTRLVRGAAHQQRW